MFSKTLYCPVCGCSFSSALNLRDPSVESDDDDIIAQHPLLNNYVYDSRILPEEQTRWLERMVVLEKSETDGSIIISPPASPVPSSYEVSIPLPSGESRTVIAYEPDGSNIALPVHTACLEVLSQVIDVNIRRSSYGEKREITSLKAFVDAVQKRSCENKAERDRMMEKVQLGMEMAGGGFATAGGVDWEDHRYYGARQFWQDGWQEETGWEWLCSDPVNIPSLTKYVVSLIRYDESGTQQPESTMTCMTPESNPPSSPLPLSPLECLPEPALASVASHLSVPALLRLRASSGIMASRIRMGQWFWRRRLLEGSLVTGLWDLCENNMKWNDVMAWDWKGLGKKLAEEQDLFEDVPEDSNIPLGLRNRRRIWKLIDLLG